MKKILSLISLMFVFIVSLFFVACGEKAQKDIDLNGDGIVEEWEKNFKGIKASQTRVDADIEVSNIEEFNNLSNKIVELQTREPQQATDVDGQPVYDEETHKPIYIPETEPILNPVVKLTKDIDFNGEEIDCQDLKGATFFGNNKVLKNFKLRALEDSEGAYFNHYNLFANAKSITELYVFMGFQDFTLEQVNAGGDNNHIDFTLFRDCYKLENITVKGMFNLISKSNVELNVSLLSYNSQYFDLYDNDIDKESNDSDSQEIEGLNISNCSVIGRINYSDDAEEDSMRAVNLSGLSVVSLIDYNDVVYTNEFSTNVVNNSVDVTIDFNKKKNSTKLAGDDEFLSSSDFIGCENVNISGVLSARRDSGNIVVDNCTSNLVLNIKQMYLVAAVGGISGSSNFNSTIKNCKATTSVLYGASIDADKFVPTITMGGIVGNTKGKILACDSTFNLEMNKNTSSINIGGIAGRMISNGEISNCNVNTNIKCNGATPQGYVFVGGLAGYFENSLAYNNNMSGSIVAEQYLRTILGGFIGASVDSTGIRNISHINITNTNSLDTFVSSLLGVAYGGNYESCMSTGNVETTGYIYERTQVVEEESGYPLETPITNFAITGYTNISIGLVFNYPFRNPERYNFSESGSLEDLENINQNGEEVSTHVSQNNNFDSDEWLSSGLIIDRFKENNKVIYNIYNDNLVGDQEEGYVNKESLNSLTAVPSIKNCLILSKHNIEYLNLDEKANNKQLYNPKDVFKYVALNGLWASQNEGQFSYNTTIYLNNVQVYDLESTTSSAVSLLTVNNYGDSAIFGIIGSTQIKQMTNITRDNVWGCVRVYDKELLISDEEIAIAVKNAKFTTGEAISYYDKELSLSGAGGEMFDLIIQSNYVKDTINEDESDEDYDEDENEVDIQESPYDKSLQDEINTLIAYSINQMGKVSDRVFTINFIMNLKDSDLLEDRESTTGIITSNNEESWKKLNAFEHLFITMVDRTVNDIVFVDESKLSEDYVVEENGKYVTIRYASVRDGVSYVDAYKFQRINQEDFITHTTDEDGNEVTYYSLKLTMFFSTSKAE